MTVKDIAEKLGLHVFTPETGLDRTVTGGYTSDLLSDVVAHAREGMVWVTLQTHVNIIGVAVLKNLAAIVIVNGLTPDEDTITIATREGIPILGTDMPAFGFSGVLYNLLWQNRP